MKILLPQRDGQKSLPNSGLMAAFVLSAIIAACGKFAFPHIDTLRRYANLVTDTSGGLFFLINALGSIAEREERGVTWLALVTWWYPLRMVRKKEREAEGAFFYGVCFSLLLGSLLIICGVYESFHPSSN